MTAKKYKLHFLWAKLILQDTPLTLSEHLITVEHFLKFVAEDRQTDMMVYRAAIAAKNVQHSGSIC